MLTDVVDAYLTRQRSLGMRFESAGQMLRQFCRAMGNPEIGEVTPEAVADFLHGKGALSATWMLRYKSPDRPVQVRRQSRVREPLAIAGHFAQAAAAANSLCLFRQKNCADCWKRRRSCGLGTALKCQRCTARSSCCCTEAGCVLARHFA